MKIGIDARMYGVGFTGIGRYTAELIEHLAKYDKENEYVLFMRKEPFEKFECPNQRFRKVLADFPHYSFGEQFGFNKVLKQENLDLMHFTHFNAPIFYNRPFVVTIHDLTLSFFPGKKMTGIFQRMAYHKVLRSVTRKARKIIAVSNNTKKDLMETLKIPEDRIIVIYNGVSAKFGGVKPTPRPELYKALGLNRPYFLYTGVWRDHKNLVGLIKAFAAFNEETGKQYELVITGQHNPTYHEVPDTVEELGVENSVHLVGLVSEENVYSLYLNALAYVFPSFYEGFGLPPLEAMQCGTPVLVSNVSAIPEVCGEGNAVYFDPYNIEDIKQKMLDFIKDPTLRQKLIDRGRERVKFFSWDKMVEGVLEVYKTAVK
ncbi:glycosyltransferase family 4 protein [Candidatus Peregrinibacteria bacterium]|nr:glycosyltransferase family 4 protein [Candidatus Peregrinibacteria bacterium]